MMSLLTRLGQYLRCMVGHDVPLNQYLRCMVGHDCKVGHDVPLNQVGHLLEPNGA